MERSSKAERESFKCPFELKGEKEGTIIEVTLSEERKQRFVAMRAAFAQFEKMPEAPAIRFILPPSLLRACKTNAELAIKLRPYQAELLATELDYRLDPFLPYQYQKVPREVWQTLGQERRDKVSVAAALAETMKEKTGIYPASVERLAKWIERTFDKAATKIGKDAALVIYGFDNHGLEIRPPSITLITDREKESAGIGDNENHFSIVKSPFYPKEFGRYSDRIEIAVSREKDIDALSTKTRQNIRRSSNEVLQAHGVPIRDFDEDKQPLGVWVPEYKKQKE